MVSVVILKILRKGSVLNKHGVVPRNRRIRITMKTKRS